MPSIATGTVAWPEAAIDSGTSPGRGPPSPSAAIAKQSAAGRITLRRRAPDAADAAVAELDRGAAEVDVEGRRELAEPRARQRLVLDQQSLEQLRILDALDDQVALVRLVAFDERLRRHDAL